MFDIEYTNLAITQVPLHKTMFAQLLLHCSFLKNTNAGHCGYLRESSRVNITFVVFIYLTAVEQTASFISEKGRIKILQNSSLTTASEANRNFFLPRKSFFP